MFYSWVLSCHFPWSACQQVIYGVHHSFWSAAESPVTLSGHSSPSPVPRPMATVTIDPRPVLQTGPSETPTEHVYIQVILWQEKGIWEKRKTHFNRYPFLTPLNSAQCEWSPYAWAGNFSFASKHMFDSPFSSRRAPGFSLYYSKASEGLLPVPLESFLNLETVW